MKIASLIIEFFEGRGEELRSALLPFKNLTIFGEKDSKLVVVIESGELDELTRTIDKLSEISSVKEVIPVYISEL